MRALIAVLGLTATAAVLTSLAGPVGAAPQVGQVFPRWTTPPTEFPTPTPSPGQATGPSNLRVTAISPTSITLAWDAAVPGAAPIRDYTVSYYYSPFSYLGPSGTVPVGNATTGTITGLTGGTQLVVSVYAMDTANQKSTGAYLGLITPVATTGDVVPPTSPGDLRQTGQTEHGVYLAWTPATDNVGVVAYDVYQYSDNLAPTLLVTTTDTSVYAPVRSVRPFPGTIFVRARDAAGNSSLASIGIPAPLVSSASPSVSPSVSPLPPTPVCTVDYRTVSTWRGGFVAELTVTNSGTATIRDWSLAFAYSGGQRVTNAWNVAFTQAGDSVVLSGLRWNRNLPPGGRVQAGIIGRTNAVPVPPTAASLNGSACTVRQTS